jgi:uncharacterized protein
VSRDLYNAIMNGDLDLFDTLALQAQASEVTESEKWNYLHKAFLIPAESPSLTMIQRLLAWGVDVNARDMYGNLPLHYAARQTTLQASETIRLLIEAGSDVNALNRDGRSPLRQLIVSNPQNVAAVRYLLAAGADANQKKPGGRSVKEMVEMNPATDEQLKKLFAG